MVKIASLELKFCKWELFNLGAISTKLRDWNLGIEPYFNSDLRENADFLVFL